MTACFQSISTRTPSALPLGFIHFPHQHTPNKVISPEKARNYQLFDHVVCYEIYKAYHLHQVLPGPPSNANLSPKSATIRNIETCKHLPSHNAWSDLVILCLRMAITSKFRRLPQQASSEPRSMSLPFMCHDLHLQAPAFRSSASSL